MMRGQNRCRQAAVAAQTWLLAVKTRRSTRALRRPWALALLCLLLPVGCGQSSHRPNGTAPSGNGVLTGTITNEQGQTLAAATLCVEGKSPCTTTDAAGQFKLPYTPSTANPLPLSIAAPGYARRSIRMRLSDAEQAPILLRQADLVQTVALPTAGGNTVVLDITHGDAKSQLHLGPDVFVTPSGDTAVGNANVSFTFWNPIEPLWTVPSKPVTLDDNGLKSLVTYGMADIEVEQNGALLQVAQGQNLLWTIQEPNGVAATLSPNAMIHEAIPDLYYLEPRTGVWQLQGTAATGALSWDANTGTFAANLPHLTGWNIDGDANSHWGGCVSGRIVDACGAPLPNKAITLWFLGHEEFKDWTGYKTDGSGRFCIPTYLSSFNVTYKLYGTHYFIAAAENPRDTTMCAPAPDSCYNCVDEDGPYSLMGWCSNCSMRDQNGVAGHIEGHDPTVYYDNTCGAAALELIPFTFCETGGCTEIPDAILSAPTCGVQPPPTPAPKPDPCAAGGSGKKQGQACGKTDVCCPLDKLTCADGLCVPSSDPNVVIR
jgi:hypothetical protein